MKLSHLKPVRVGMAVLFFLLTATLFLDFRHIGANHVAKEVLFLQFVPSVLNFMGAAALGAAGFIVVLALTLLFGRVYCSTICPLGTLQDLISRLRGKKKKRRFIYSRPHNFIRYPVFILTVLLFLAGSGLMLNLLDPFSIFGRIFSNLLRPFVIAMNNLAAPLMEQLENHFLYQVQWPAVAPLSIAVSLIMLALVSAICMGHGRLYCNTLCPVGTLLGLVSKAALFRISIDRDACRECRLCESACKASCIDLQEMEIDLSRCIACYNCLTACPGDALRFAYPWENSADESSTSTGRGRRKFMLSLAACGLGMTADASEKPEPVIPSRPTTVPVRRINPVSPPGSVSIARFTSTCTACHLCVSICPTSVLVPSFFEYGPSGIMQPRMNFESGYCTYDCIACLDVCPTRAILPLAREKKKLTQLGTAKFIKENCVVYTDNTNCGACSEHCPTKAVHMVPYLNLPGKKLVIPEVNPEICVGCGACEHACPTRPYRAIYVEGNPEHLIAKKPKQEKIEQKVDDSADFPF